MISRPFISGIHSIYFQLYPELSCMYSVSLYIHCTYFFSDFRAFLAFGYINTFLSCILTYTCIAISDLSYLYTLKRKVYFIQFSFVLFSVPWAICQKFYFMFHVYSKESMKRRTENIFSFYQCIRTFLQYEPYFLRLFNTQIYLWKSSFIIKTLRYRIGNKRNACDLIM